MYCPARYGARISQSFTATDASIAIREVEEVIYVEDMNTLDGRYCFTDGVGTMSKELGIEISQELRSKRRRGRYNKNHPRAYQVRFMGSKGMLSVDHSLNGRVVCLRPSMIKFEAPQSPEIEIARAFDRPGPYFLNRPLIMLLEGLGVPFDVFKKFQDKAVQETYQSTQSLAHAARTLESHGLGTSYRLPSVMLALEKLGINDISSDFYRKMLQYAINHILRVLKNYARIPIPDAWTLVGVADVHKFLKEGEIFACIKPTHGSAIFLEGPVLISRSPTIHPGDVQIAIAIGKPPESSCFSKESLPNTVVFSVLGALEMSFSLRPG
jgi:RNA-dependent RNA polymerase